MTTNVKWKKLVDLSDELDSLTGPFQPKEAGEERALQAEKARVQASIAQDATAFLKAHGVKSNGLKDHRRKNGKKIPGL